MNAMGVFAQKAVGAWMSWMAPMAWQVFVLAVLVWLVTGLFRRSSATFRYTLWLLVFVKLVLPPMLGVPWSIRTNVERFIPLKEAGQETPFQIGNWAIVSRADSTTGSADDANAGPSSTVSAASLSYAALVVWAVVAGLLMGAAGFQYQRYRRRIARETRPAPPELAERVRALADKMGVRRRFEVHIGPPLSVPAVFGFWHPVILLPEDLLDRLSGQQLDYLLSHELAHIRRYDAQVGLAASLLVCLYWFHPLVWLASFQLRREREMACDDAVLYSTRQVGKDYASTLVSVAETFGKPAPVGAGFLGLLEMSNNLVARIHSVLDVRRPRKSGWGLTAVAVVIMLFVMPMGGCSKGGTQPKSAADVASGPPRIVSTIPTNGDAEVDPGLKAIHVTFDQDMDAGFSWTGGGPDHPAALDTPYWIEKRTCVYAVKLEAAKYYRLGINSKSHQNFKSAAGIPAQPSVIAFTTRGAGSNLVDGLQPPHVVSMIPANGATGVDPNLDRLTVAFDQEMGGGFSWTGGGEQFPKGTGKPTWSADKKICTFPVTLKPGGSYRLGLNSPSHKNFQSAHGIPLEPVVWRFIARQ